MEDTIWEDIIKINLKEIRCDKMWSGLHWLRIGSSGELS
jgi:hypothetical protein